MRPPKTVPRPHATLEVAIRIARAIEAEIEHYGAHVALTGGCLYRGSSGKDVDIMIYPHNTKLGYSKDSIIRALELSACIVIRPELSIQEALVQPATQTSSYLDKDVYVATWNRADLAGIRVDLIFMHS